MILWGIVANNIIFSLRKPLPCILFPLSFAPFIFPLVPQRHVAPGALRVKVLQGAESAGATSSELMLYAKDLAFDYDLVLTTFSRLSSEWESDYSRMHLGNGGEAAGRRLLTQVGLLLGQHGQHSRAAQ